MGCELVKKTRFRFLAAPPGTMTRIEHPHLARDRVYVTDPMWICGDGISTELGQCMIEGCKQPVEFECDGCDVPMCAAHATNRGRQEVQTDTGFTSPGWSRMAFEDTFDLCPFCIFNGVTKHPSAKTEDK